MIGLWARKALTRKADSEFSRNPNGSNLKRSRFGDPYENSSL
jgi:hypothetical protein